MESNGTNVIQDVTVISIICLQKKRFGFSLGVALTIYSIDYLVLNGNEISLL